MSAPHVSWALRVRKLKPAQRLVLCAIAERANGDLACWPSISMIANDIELTTRAVYLAIDYLENDRQLIRKVTGDERDQLLTRGGFRGHPQVNVYQLIKTEIPDSRVINGYTPEHSSPQPLNTVHPEHSSPVNTVQKTSELSSPKPLIESPIEKKGSVLRTGEPAAPPAGGKKPEVIKILYDEGLPILRDLTGKSRDACARMVGRLRRDHGDDCAAVLTALHRAQHMHPTAAMAFLQGTLKANGKANGIEAIQARLFAAIDARASAEAEAG